MKFHLKMMLVAAGDENCDNENTDDNNKSIDIIVNNHDDTLAILVQEDIHADDWWLKS